MEPYHNMEFFKEMYYSELSSEKVKKAHFDNPKGAIQTFVMNVSDKPAKYTTEEGYVGGRRQPSMR
jgi:hypothetical protein